MNNWFIKTNFFKNIMLILGVSFSSIYAHNNTIDFYTAVQCALSTNPQIIASNARVRAAQAAITEVRGAGLPKVSVESNIIRSNNPLTVFGEKLMQGNASFADFGFNQFSGPGSLLTRPEALNDPGYYSNFNNALVINVPIFQGGNNLAIIEQMSALLNAAKHGDRSARNELIYAVFQAYEGVRSTMALVGITRHAQVTAAKYLDMTRRLQQQSITINSDVLIAESNLHSINTSLAVITTELNNYLDTFRILIGKPYSNLVPGGSVKLPSSKEDEGILIQKALAINTKLLSLEAQTIAAQALVSANKSRYLPTIDFQLRNDWNSKTLKFTKPSNSALLRMQWQLFNSGEHFGAIQRSLALRDEARAQQIQLSDHLRLSIKQSIRAIEIAEKQIEAGIQQEQQMTMVVTDLVKRYGQGIIPLGQLLDAQSRLDVARKQKIIHEYNKTTSNGQLLNIIHGLDSILTNHHD